MKKWNEKNKLEKGADIISGIAFGIWLIFEALERRNAVEYADLVSCILLCVICACEAVSFWNQKRSLSYVAIVGASVLIISLVLLALL